MDFYYLSGAEKYAGYMGFTEAEDALVNLHVPPNSEEWIIPHLTEYLGDPPRKPLRKGDYHSSGQVHYFSERAIDCLGHVLSTSGIWLPVRIQDRVEPFYRFWVTHKVDCLNVGESKIVNYRLIPLPNQLGVIQKPVFREDAWDGSDVFHVPGDPNNKFFVSERFVELCKKHRIKGMEFRRGYDDDHPIIV